MQLSFQILTIIFANTLTCSLIFKYIVRKDTKINILINKIIDMENDINELHETIDLLEDRLHQKHIDMRQSNENIINQIDHFIESNYDIT